MRASPGPSLRGSTEGPEAGRPSQSRRQRIQTRRTTSQSQKSVGRHPAIHSCSFRPLENVAHASSESYYQPNQTPHRIFCTPSNFQPAPPFPLHLPPIPSPSTADHAAHAAHAHTPAALPNALPHPDRNSPLPAASHAPPTSNKLVLTYSFDDLVTTHPAPRRRHQLPQPRPPHAGLRTPTPGRRTRPALHPSLHTSFALRRRTPRRSRRPRPHPHRLAHT